MKHIIYALSAFIMAALALYCLLLIGGLLILLKGFAASMLAIAALGGLYIAVKQVQAARGIEEDTGIQFVFRRIDAPVDGSEE